MSTERVDKAWQVRGLEAYSVAAIVGTLNHYGVAVDEAGFKALAEEAYPLAIAHEWHVAGWKGTGQFQRFPAAAAEELWRRVKPGAFAPTDVALALINLLKALDTALSGTPDDGTRDTRLTVVERYVDALPAPSEQRERFIEELTVALNDWLEPLDGMAEALAHKKLFDLADRFVALEEKLFPVRGGSARALVRAAKGEVAEALADLEAIASDAARDGHARLAAIDAFIALEHSEPARRHTLAVLEKAEQDKDVDLASEAVHRLDLLLKKDPRVTDRQQVMERVERLAAVFNGD